MRALAATEDAKLLACAHIPGAQTQSKERSMQSMERSMKAKTPSVQSGAHHIVCTYAKRAGKGDNDS